MNRTQLTVVALLVSIAVNLLLLGGIGYRMLSLPEPGIRPFPPGVGWVTRDLSDARRSELAPLLDASEGEIRTARAAMFAAQRRVNELMVAEPLDNAAISAAFADLRDASQHYQTLSHQQTVAVMQQLTAEERQAALEFIRRGGPRGNGGSRRPGMPPTPDPNGPPRQ